MSKKKMSMKERALNQKLLTDGERKDVMKMTEQELSNHNIDCFISFLIPIAGLILYYKKRDKIPHMARGYLFLAILGPIVFIEILWIISYIVAG